MENRIAGKKPTSEKKQNGKKTIVWYGIPAYGHTCSNLFLADALAKMGFRVLYYSMAPFREMIEANGCEYRAYPVLKKLPDLSDGKRILKLYRLLLEYTRNMLPSLLQEAERNTPCCVIFESLALWGRAVGFLRGIPSFSFYSIVAVRKVGESAFFEYGMGFWADFWRYIGEIPKAVSVRRQLKQNYGLPDLGLLPVLMNSGDYNLMGYTAHFQPDGKKFGKEYRFLGPLSAHRTVTETNDFTCPGGTLIYVSLGTIFHEDKRLLEELIKQFGEAGEEPIYKIVMVTGEEGKDEDKDACVASLPANFIGRPFVNQLEILKRASLFISAGGMNSIHEALWCGVPCLLYPQQGEQLVNARRFEQMGFGRILKRIARLRTEAERAMQLRYTWDETLRAEMTAVHMEDVLPLFRRWQEGQK